MQMQIWKISGLIQFYLISSLYSKYFVQDCSFKSVLLVTSFIGFKTSLYKLETLFLSFTFQFPSGTWLNVRLFSGLWDTSKMTASKHNHAWTKKTWCPSQIPLLLNKKTTWHLPWYGFHIIPKYVNNQINLTRRRYDFLQF